MLRWTVRIPHTPIPVIRHRWQSGVFSYSHAHAGHCHNYVSFTASAISFLLIYRMRASSINLEPAACVCTCIIFIQPGACAFVLRTKLGSYSAGMNIEPAAYRCITVILQIMHGHLLAEAISATPVTHQAGLALHCTAGCMHAGVYVYVCAAVPRR